MSNNENEGREESEFIKGHLNVQYSPSKWSTRMCACKVIEEHYTFIKTESNKARSQIPSQLNVAYGTTKDEKMDIIGVDLPDDAPICFFVHGGFWKALSKEESTYPALTLHPIGIKTFVIDYTLCPRVTLKTITEQIEKAFEFTLKYADEKKSRRIYLMGHSAGAHLVAYLLGTHQFSQTSTSSILAITAILVSGIYDLRPLLHCNLNEHLHLSQQDAIDLSPVLLKRFKTNLDRKKQEVSCFKHWLNLNVYVIIAENDSPAFHNDSKQFYSSLQEKNINSNYLLLQGKDHFDIMQSIVPTFNDNLFELTDNFDDILKNILK